MEKFKNKYRIPSARLQHWDYRRNAAYFITICTQNREPYFGEIDNGKMKFSPIGVIADILWYEIKNHTTGVELGAFIVMPNHVHGILILNGDDAPDGGDAVQTLHATSVHSAISPKSGSVSTIIRSYKSAVTKHAHRLGFDFAWQTRFYDHIIRNDVSFRKISDYIMNNPVKWNMDKFYNESDTIKQ
jgi:REP element-mobilizing transposase RayT